MISDICRRVCDWGYQPCPLLTPRSTKRAMHPWRRRQRTQPRREPYAPPPSPQTTEGDAPCKMKREQRPSFIIPDSSTGDEGGAAAVRLPQEMWVHVLSWLPPREVLAVASLVSRRWYHLARDELLWHLICIRQGRGPALAPPACKPESWLTFYFSTPPPPLVTPQLVCSPARHARPHTPHATRTVPQNLLRNPGAEEGIGEGLGWQLRSGGDGWAVGELDNAATAEQLGGCQRFFISSYSVPLDTHDTTHTTNTTHPTTRAAWLMLTGRGPSVVRQEANGVAGGEGPERGLPRFVAAHPGLGVVLRPDRLRKRLPPHRTTSSPVAAAQSHLGALTAAVPQVKLLDGEGAVLEKWATGRKEAQTHWTQEEHVFRNYPPGVRYLTPHTRTTAHAHAHARKVQCGVVSSGLKRFPSARGVER